MKQETFQDGAGHRFNAVKMLNRMALVIVCAAIVLNFPGCSGGGGVFDCDPEIGNNPFIVTPNAGLQGTTVSVELAASGNTFGPNSTVMVGGTGVTANIQSISLQRITATFTIAANAPVGRRSVIAGKGTGTFTILAANAPLLLSVTPDEGTRGSTVNVTLNGANFAPGATLAVSGTGVTVSNVQVISATQITATFTIAANASADSRMVTVTTGQGTSNSVDFLVKAPFAVDAPVLNSVSPNRSTMGTAVNVTLTGSRFAPGATVAVDGTGVAVSNVQVVSSTQITATFTIAANAALSQRNVTVTVAGKTSNSALFRVAPPTPTLNRITPTAGTRGSPVSVVLIGTNFPTVAGAFSQVQAGAGIAVSNVRVINATQITALFTIATNATLGPRNVTVATDGGTSNAVTFTVNPAVNNAAPTLTNINPAELRQGASRQIVLTGTNFTAGTTVAITGTGVTISNVRIDSATQITATFSAASRAPFGRRQVTVTNSNGTSNSREFLILEFICETC